MYDFYIGGDTNLVAVPHALLAWILGGISKRIGSRGEPRDALAQAFVALHSFGSTALLVFLAFTAKLSSRDAFTVQVQGLRGHCVARSFAAHRLHESVTLKSRLLEFGTLRRRTGEVMTVVRIRRASFEHAQAQVSQWTSGAGGR